jgi:hypothetical protein
MSTRNISLGIKAAVAGGLNLLEPSGLYRTLPEKLTVSQQLKESLPLSFRITGSFLLCAQDPITFPYPVPDEPTSQTVPFFQVVPSERCIYFAFPPYVPHAYPL